MTKAGLISLTESVAAEVKEHGIDVNAICPGGVDTEGYRDAFDTRGRADNPKLMLPEPTTYLNNNVIPAILRPRSILQD